MSIEGLDSQSALDVAFSDDSTVGEMRGAMIYLFLVKQEESLRNLNRILRTVHFSKLREFIVRLLLDFGTSKHVDAFITILRRGSVADRDKLLPALMERVDKNDDRIQRLIRRFLL